MTETTTQAPAATTTAPVTTAAPATNGAAAPWYNDFKDPAAKEWLAAYGDAYPNPESVALKALNLEKFITADKAGRGVIIPRDDAKPEEKQAFWKKLGAPEKVDGYKLSEEQAKDPIIVKWREGAHALGVPASMFAGMLGAFSKAVEAEKTVRAARYEQQADEEMNTLKTTEWQGDLFDKNTELARRAARQFLPHKDDAEFEGLLDKMESVLGTATTMKLWAAVGAGVGEHQFHDGEGGGGGGAGNGAQARIQIANLKQDTDFGKKLAAGDAEATAKWTKLHQISAADPR